MQKDKFVILLIIIMFIISIFLFVPFGKISTIEDVISPTSFLIDKKEVNIKDLETFDAIYTKRNLDLAKELGITEDEAFIMGNLAKYWADNLMKNRQVLVKDDSDLIFLRNSYRDKFIYSGYCLKDNAPCFYEAFKNNLLNIRRTNYAVLDLDSNQVYDIKDSKVRDLKEFLVVRKRHLPKGMKNLKPLQKYDNGNVKVYFSDMTKNLSPSNECSTLICQEILNNINNSQKTIDIAIYGYSYVPEIENAIKNAILRGVNVRLVYDRDSNGKNIYPNTDDIVKIIPKNKSDGNSVSSKNIMHNKFYIFDNKIVITGSANLSHTDMSGFNTNNIIVIDNEYVAKIYKSEFEQMYNGKFHSEKKQSTKRPIFLSGMKLNIYFSPQDKVITNAILPLIKNAEKYIYIPTFVLTEKRVTDELIKAKKRGVDIKIILDALNGSIKHSKHEELRLGGISVKTENYAGKMHSKSMIIDDKYTIIGSMNFSNSGENKNDENLIIIEDSNLAKFYKEFFIYQWDLIDDKWLKYNARAEGKDSIGSCFDGLDNNYDGLTDLRDNACK